MNPFAYQTADTLAEALAAKREGGGGVRFVAGGTNLLDLMKEHVERPARLIDINGLPLTAIEDVPGGGLRLGALARNADTAYDPRVRERYPLLASAILAGASPQIRNMATNGGNLLQRTRCHYFYDTSTPCNKRLPGSGCSAIGGIARQLAILGTSPQCIATHPSDFCVALAALEAVVHVQAAHGARRIAFGDFHRLPGQEPERDTTLADDELILVIELPEADRFRKHSVYLKIRERASYAFALVSVAAMLALDEAGSISELRIALGGVAHKPWRRPEAELAAIGKPADASSFAQIADALLEGAEAAGEGENSNAFKIPLARRAIVRALQTAAAGTVTNLGDNLHE